LHPIIFTIYYHNTDSFGNSDLTSKHFYISTRKALFN